MRVELRVFGAGIWVALVACQAEAPEPRFVREVPAALTTRPGAPPTERGEPSRPPVDQRAPTKPLAPRQGVPQAAPVAPPASITRRPTTPDPLGGKFSLAEATKGLPKKGTLQATIETGLGTLVCSLYADKTPNTVANFVGLARGLRPFWDGKQASWVKRPLFDGTSFHRAIADFMIQGGDHLGDGTGTVGYDIPDELVGLKHDRAGLLCMANRGPNTNGGQFFITDAAAPHLTQMNTYTIFGECTPLEVIRNIARAPRANSMSEKPEPVIPISRVTISRK